MTIQQTEHIDQDGERALRAAFYEDIKAGRLSVTEAVATMRRISQLTPEEFAKHRGIDVDTFKQIESGATDQMIAALNQIGAIFGLEVRFVPVHKPNTAATSTPVEILQRAHAACLALAVYRDMTLDAVNADADKILDLTATISQSADAIASILTPPDLGERDRLRRLATIAGSSLTARCLHRYVTQQVPELEQVLRAALDRAAAGSPC